MKWIDEVTKVYQQYFKESLDKLGFLKYEEMDGHGMGALIKLKNNSFKVQILNDRGILETDISSLFGHEQFIGVSLFNSFIRLCQLDSDMSQLERRKILGTILDYSGQRDFLVANHATLAELLSEENYRQTLKRIEAIGRERFE